MTVTRTTYRCDGCGARIDNKKDLLKDDGTRPKWKCKRCQTTIPSITAERISHQKQRPR